MVVDHSGYAVSATEGDHTLIASDDFIKSDVILGSKKIEASELLILLRTVLCTTSVVGSTNIILSMLALLFEFISLCFFLCPFCPFSKWGEICMLLANASCTLQCSFLNFLITYDRLQYFSRGLAIH